MNQCVVASPRAAGSWQSGGMPGAKYGMDAPYGFGFVGLVFGSFVGWCAGLLSRVASQTLLEYIMLGAGIGIIIGVISGYLVRHRVDKSKQAT